MSELRTLVILRHARAESGEVGRDELRALALEGRKQANEVGKRLNRAELLPDLVLCSSAVRTRQTWDLVAHGLGGQPEVGFRDELYAASTEDVLDVIHGMGSQVSSALLIGHEPAVSAVSAHLAGAGSDEAALAQVRVGIPTATFTVLKSPAPWPDWTGGAARLEGVFRPTH